MTKTYCQNRLSDPGTQYFNPLGAGKNCGLKAFFKEIPACVHNRMYGNIAGSSSPLRRSSAAGSENGAIMLKKSWSGEIAAYPDAGAVIYTHEAFFFARIV